MTDEMAQAGGPAPRRGRSWWQHPGVLVVAVAVAASVVAVVLSLGRSDDDVDENFNPTTPVEMCAGLRDPSYDVVTNDEWGRRMDRSPWELRRYVIDNCPEFADRFPG